MCAETDHQVEFQVNILNSTQFEVELLIFSTQFKLNYTYFQFNAI